jgi:hypothetical protein
MIRSRTRFVQRTVDGEGQRLPRVALRQTTDHQLAQSSELLDRLRAANTMATDSASRQRAANASAFADARSSHCASSIRHTSGCVSTASDNRLRTARLTRKRSGVVPEIRPNAAPSASREGPVGARACPALARTTGVAPRTRAPSPTRRRRRGRRGNQRPNPSRTRATPSCRRQARRASRGRRFAQRAHPRADDRAFHTRCDDPRAPRFAPTIHPIAPWYSVIRQPVGEAWRTSLTLAATGSAGGGHRGHLFHTSSRRLAG